MPPPIECRCHPWPGCCFDFILDTLSLAWPTVPPTLETVCKGGSLCTLSDCWQIDRSKSIIHVKMRIAARTFDSPLQQALKATGVETQSQSARALTHAHDVNVMSVWQHPLHGHLVDRLLAQRPHKCWHTLALLPADGCAPCRSSSSKRSDVHRHSIQSPIAPIQKFTCSRRRSACSCCSGVPVSVNAHTPLVRKSHPHT